MVLSGSAPKIIEKVYAVNVQNDELGVVKANMLSVCSPVHNEQENLREFVVQVISAVEPEYSGRWELLLVNDGSSDRSGKILEELSTQYPQIRIINHPENKGERATWKTAFDSATGEIVAILAADLQSRPDAVPLLAQIVEDKEHDVATACRMSRKDGAFYSLMTKVLTIWCQVLHDVRVRDVSSSFFAVRSSFVKDLPFDGNDHRYILPILRRRGARIKEIMIEHMPRAGGASHYTKIKVLKAIPETFLFSLRCLRGHYDKKLS